MVDVHVTANGEVPLPSAVRNRHKIRPGTRLSLAERGNELILTVGPGAIEGEAMETVPSMAFMDGVGRLADQGRIDTALDLIYDRIDDLFLAGRFEDVDTLLGRVNVRECSVDILLGILTATLPAKNRLPSRREFFNNVEAFLVETGEMEEGLLSGLEP